MVRHPLHAAFGILRGIMGGVTLTLIGSFPARVRSTERTFAGTVTVVNDSERRVEALAASRPDVHLVRSGKSVTRPLPRDELGLQLDLAPGATRDLAATGSLTSGSPARPLPPGRYEIHAVLPIVGEAPAVGGPWRLEVV
jgi:hypothetical protein